MVTKYVGLFKCRIHFGYSCLKEVAKLLTANLMIYHWRVRCFECREFIKHESKSI